MEHQGATASCWIPPSHAGVPIADYITKYLSLTSATDAGAPTARALREFEAARRAAPPASRAGAALSLARAYATLEMAPQARTALDPDTGRRMRMLRMLDRHAVQALLHAWQTPGRLPTSSGSRGAWCNGLRWSRPWRRWMTRRRTRPGGSGVPALAMGSRRIAVNSKIGSGARLRVSSVRSGGLT